MNGYVVDDVVLKYFLLLDDRHVRQRWLDQLELDDEARVLANNLMNALRDAVPWAIRAIEGHLVGPGRSDFSRRMLGETATAIVEAITKESFQMAEARGVAAIAEMLYHSKARDEAEGYLALHARLVGVELDERWMLRLACEIRDCDPEREAWPRVLIRLGDAVADVLGHRRPLDDDDTTKLLELIRRPNAKPTTRRERDIVQVRAQLEEAMNLGRELSKRQNLRVREAWKMAARRLPLFKMNGEPVKESMRAQIIRTSPEKLRAAMEEAQRSGSKQRPRSGSKGRT